MKTNSKNSILLITIMSICAILLGMVISTQISKKVLKQNKFVHVTTIKKLDTDTHVLLKINNMYKPVLKTTTPKIGDIIPIQIGNYTKNLIVFKIINTNVIIQGEKKYATIIKLKLKYD